MSNEDNKPNDSSISSGIDLQASVAKKMLDKEVQNLRDEINSATNTFEKSQYQYYNDISCVCWLDYLFGIRNTGIQSH